MEKEKTCRLAERKVFLAVNTKSLNKLEKIIAANPDHEYKYAIAILAHYRKKEKLNPVNHPNLIRLSEEFEKALKRAQEDDPYYQNWNVLVNVGDKRENSRLFKQDSRKLILEILEKNNFSIRMLVENSNTKYANVYNYLEKEDYSTISPRAVHRLLWAIVSMDQGWSAEEKMDKLLEKWNILQEYWEEK